MNNTAKKGEYENPEGKLEYDPDRTYTAEEYFRLDLPVCTEFIDGKVYFPYGEPVEGMSPAPSLKHQDIVLGLGSEIRQYIRKNKSKCRVFVAPVDVRMNNNRIIQPDVFVVCDSEKITGNMYDGAPDWIIEVVSPSNSSHDYRDKLIMYNDAGVKEYWIVDPADEKVIVYIFDKSAVGFYTFDDRITVGLYKNEAQPLALCVNEILYTETEK